MHYSYATIFILIVVGVLAVAGIFEIRGLVKKGVISFKQKRE